MKTCPYTGCNSPQGQCASDGACMERHPAKHFHPQTMRQQSKVLRSIDEAEAHVPSDLAHIAERTARAPLRYFPEQYRRIDIDLTELEGVPISRARLALNTFNLYWRNAHGLRFCFRKALAAFRSRS